MANHCFYCDYEIENENTHFVNFFHSQEEREEPLCQDCYKEWLEGIKG